MIKDDKFEDEEFEEEEEEEIAERIPVTDEEAKEIIKLMIKRKELEEIVEETGQPVEVIETFFQRVTWGGNLGKRVFFATYRGTYKGKDCPFERIRFYFKEEEIGNNIKMEDILGRHS